MNPSPPPPIDSSADEAGPVPAFAPLSRPVFRMLWLAWLAANLSMWMNDVASSWLMTQLTTSPVMVALVQTAATLPVFVLGLPCGAIADIVDRRRWFMFTQMWVAVTALLLVVASVTGALNDTLLLVLVFANGIGLAMRWPVFAAIVPDVVPRRELGAALALNGVSMNLSRIIGPVLAGALIASLGSMAVYALNAVLALVATFLIWRWKDEPRVSALPGERFVGAMRVGLQYVRQSPSMRIVLLRIFVFFLQSTALLALLPLVAQRIAGAHSGGGDGGAGTYTVMLACMGFGAIVVALGATRIRTRLDRDTLINVGVLAHAAATAVVAWAPSLWLALPAMVVSGAAWISVANSLTLTAQLSLPDWVRARGMSIYQTALMGGSALGAALWGYVAARSSVSTSLWASSVVAVLLMALMWRQRVEAVGQPNLTPSRPSVDPTPAFDFAADEGPVMVTVEFIVDEADTDAFVAVMHESRRSRLQLGALSWGLFRDTANPRRFIEYFVDESWVAHLRRIDRFTAGDMHLRERRLAFHRGEGLPKVERYLAQALRR